MEYERLEPWGAWRDNFHAATIARILANAYRKPKSQPYAMDLFFYTDPATAQQERDKKTLDFFEARSKESD